MQLELTHNERLLLIFALGAVSNVPPIVAYKSEPKADPFELAGRIVALGDGRSPSADDAELHLPLGGLHGNADTGGEAQGATVPRAGERKAEQLSGGVSGRVQGGDQSQCTREVTWWAKGFPGEHQDSIESIEVTPCKIEPKPTSDDKPRLMVTWQNQGKGFSRASVWDEPLFAKLKDRTNQRTVLFVTRKGQWVNIVGVRV
jgi:hypothetical protein